jgi:type II secretory pathway pseudopilin PulG
VVKVRALVRRRRFGLRSTRQSEGGYNLVVLMVLVTVMNVAIAVALPYWSRFAQREKEAEAIFRGLQYAEAIRVFQKRHSRLPTKLEELIEIEPRALRRLYPNPLQESGQWGLLVQSASMPGGRNDPRRGARGGVRQPIGPPGSTPGQTGGVGINPDLVPGTNYVAVPPAAEGEDDVELRGPRTRTTGPLVGVYPAVDAPSQRLFFGQDNYSAWHFTVALIPLPVVVGDRSLPRVTSEWIGKPFREDLVTPSGGEGPGGSRSRDRDGGNEDEAREEGRDGRRRRGSTDEGEDAF